MSCPPGCGCGCCPPQVGDAALVVTLNPEGRVEVAAAGPVPGPARPGEWLELPVAVLNQGCVTGPLQSRWSRVAGVEVDAPDTELSGEPVQRTAVRVRLAEPGPVELTVRFWALGVLGGLANKNTAHLYLRPRDPEPRSPGGVARRM
ncbi:MAG TPA: hypothetical protein VK020_13380 [Microlunatus sp.]|nr:hypothetical protein [Microlunatus sp.]